MREPYPTETECRINVRCDPLLKARALDYAALNKDEYSNFTEFIITAIKNEMNPKEKKARLKKMLIEILTEDREIRDLLEKFKTKP